MRVILLRGLGRDQRHWQPLLEALKVEAPFLKIETPDLPGAGILYRNKSPLNLSDYIPYLEEQISDSSEATILVGLSLGGMIALEWGKQYPEKFATIVLINSSSRLNFFYQRLNIWQVFKHPSVVLNTTIRQTETAIYRLTCNSESDESVIDQWVEIQLDHPVRLANQARQVYAASKFFPPAPDLLPKIHIISSKKDTLVSPTCSLKLSKYYDAKIDYHDWAGHDLPQDDPLWVARALEKIALDSSSSNHVGFDFKTKTIEKF